MTHAHGMREEGFGWEPGTAWRGACHWLAAAGRGRGGRRGFGGHGRHGFGGPWGRHGGRRPRGDVRAAILVLLDEEPRNGYAIMQEIEERSAGAWRPSPGSVYPVLQQLEDERLGTPWDAAAAEMSEEMTELRTLIWQVGAAVLEVIGTGNAEQHAQARSLLDETRRALYRILAGDEPDKR
jgi:hypothetical protein